MNSELCCRDRRRASFGIATEGRHGVGQPRYRGTLDKLVITGPVNLANTQLAGFDLGSKLGALSTFAGKAVSDPDTSIQNVSLSARVAPEGTKADDINLTVPAVGVITGAGTVSPAGCSISRWWRPKGWHVGELTGGLNGQRERRHSVLDRRNHVESALRPDMKGRQAESRKTFWVR